MKRYSIDEEFHGFGVMVGDPSGDYVKQEDAQKLVELNKELVKFLDIALEIARQPYSCGEDFKDAAESVIKKAKELTQ